MTPLRELIRARGTVTPGEMLRIFASAGVDVGRKVAILRKGLVAAPPEVQQRVVRFVKGIRNERGLPYSPEDAQEILDVLFDGKGEVPAFFRAFAVAEYFVDENLSEQMRQLGGFQLQQVQADLHWASRWATFGLPSFQLTHSLAAALVLTEPPTYDPELPFKLPFSTFALRVPPGFIPFLDGDKKTWAELILVHAYLGKDGANPVTEELLQLDIRSHERNLWHRMPVAELLTGTRTETDPNSDLELVDDDWRAIDLSVRLVRNLVAWIEAHGHGKPEGKPLKPGQRYGRDSSGMPIPTTWVLGREVKLGPELRRMASEVALGARRGGPGWKLRMRYCVRGHWKMQAHGEGRRERKRIFVEPYWKGPEGAAAWAHVYTDGKDKEA